MAGAGLFQQDEDDVGAQTGRGWRSRVGWLCQAGGQTETRKTGLASQDLQFAQEAAMGGLKEVTLGGLARQRAEDDQVMQFGQRMVQDHGQANEKLMVIAEQKGIQLQQELPADVQQTAQELQQLSDAEFDRAYMDEMVKDHEEDVQAFEQQAESGQDPDLRAFAEEILPTLREHLELAEQIRAQITAATGVGPERERVATVGGGPRHLRLQASAPGRKKCRKAGGLPPIRRIDSRT